MKKRKRPVDRAPPTKRCPKCHKDVSATWIECCIRCNILTTEEKFFVWDTLRADQKLRRYRRRMRAKVIT